MASGDAERPRAQHGDAPRWIAWPVLATVVGIPVGVAAYVLASAAAGDGSWRDQSWPGPAISVVVVVVLLWLARSAARRRPVHRMPIRTSPVSSSSPGSNTRSHRDLSDI